MNIIKRQRSVVFESRRTRRIWHLQWNIFSIQPGNDVFNLAVSLLKATETVFILKGWSPARIIREANDGGANALHA